MILSVVVRKMRNFARRSWFEKAWLLPVWLLLGLARLAVLAVSFRRLAPRLGRHAGNTPWVPLANDGCEARATSVARVVQLAARYTPWESNCFPQAVAARVLLGLYDVPYAMFFGVARDPAGAMKAHAWVTTGRVHVTGGHSFDRFAVVACFVSPCLVPGMDDSEWLTLR